MTSGRKLLAWAITAAMAATAVPLAPPQAHARYVEVTCQSANDRRKECRVPGLQEVEIMRELGDTRCRQGRTWGVRGDTIWVARGCAAQFRVDIPGERPQADGGEVLGILALLAVVGTAAAVIDRDDRVPGESRSREAARLCKAFAVYEMRRRGARGVESNRIADLERTGRGAFKVAGRIVARFGKDRRDGNYTCRTRGDRVAEFSLR